MEKTSAALFFRWGSCLDDATKDLVAPWRKPPYPKYGGFFRGVAKKIRVAIKRGKIFPLTRDSEETFKARVSSCGDFPHGAMMRPTVG